MAKRAGDVVEPHDLTLGLPDADGNTSVGDAVALAAGDLEPADASAGHELTGIRSRGEGSGDNERTTVSGVVIANVESGITDGTDVDIVDTSVTGAPAAGTLVASSGGPGHTLSDEGGTYKGASLPTGFAAVYIR